MTALELTGSDRQSAADGATGASVDDVSRTRGDVIASFPPVLTTNPYQRLLYGELRAHGFNVVEDSALRSGWLWRVRRRVGVLHFHWPQSYWRLARGPRKLRVALSYLTLARFAARLGAARALGYRIVWTVHQVYPHEIANRRLDRLGALALARMSHLLLVHDDATAEVAERELGRSARKLAVVPHGSYVGVYKKGRARHDVRKELGLPQHAFVFLCFGDLRAYKELDLVLRAFRAAATPNARLLVTGSIGSEEHAAAVQDSAQSDPRIRPLLGFVPEARVAELFDACDAAVLARGDGGTSGALILALSLGIPVVAARTATYEQLTGGGMAGWLFEPGDADSLTDALEAAAATDPTSLHARAEAARAQVERLPWPEIGERTAALIRGREA